MQPLLAIAGLTWKAAFRFRLFLVLLALLLGSVVVLPLLLKDDGTARGFIQILLTYNLSVITGLLGFSTLWISCGTLAGDIEDCQLQLVAAKPVARWKIWAGKWLGIMMLNTVLLAVAGTSVYVLLQWRERHLPEDQRRVLENEIFVARASMTEPLPDLETAANRIFMERMEHSPIPREEQLIVRRQTMEKLKAFHQIVPPNYMRQWTIDFGLKRLLLKDQPLYIRFKFYAAQTNLTGTYLGLWEFGPRDSARGFYSHPMSLAAESFHEIEIPPNLLDDQGKLTAVFNNQNETALLFPLEDGFEVLYREGGFALNYARGLLVILSWMGLLAALGLASASLLSFPVAAFFSLSLLIVALSSGALSGVVQEGTVTGVNHESGEGGSALVDAMLLPLFRSIVAVVGLVKSFAPVDALSTGRSITWGQLGQAWIQGDLFLGGLLCLAGVWLLRRRELALPQSGG